MQILHCLWGGGTGGMERAVYQLVREQQAVGTHEPSVLFATPGGPYYEAIKGLGCPTVDIGLSSGATVKEIPRITGDMASFDAHHFHSAEPLVMAASTRVEGALRLYTHRGGTIDYGYRKRARHFVTGKLLGRSFHGMSGNTRHAARCAAQLFSLPGERFGVTYNGIDFSLLAPERTAAEVRVELGLRPDDVVLGTSANLKQWKRIDRLVRALAAIEESRLQLVIVGDGQDRNRLEDLSIRCGVAQRVHFTGEQRVVADYLQAMDIFALPSMELESFGNSVVEAMGAGLPAIIFSDGGGMTEHMIDGETGFIVDDEIELGATIRRLIDAPALRERIGGAASAHVRALYTPRAAHDGYERLYRSALEFRRSSTTR